MNERDKSRQGPTAPLSAGSLVPGIVNKVVATSASTEEIDVDTIIRKGLGNESSTSWWISTRGKISLKGRTLFVPVENSFCVKWCKEHPQVQGDIFLSLPQDLVVETIEFVVVAGGEESQTTPPVNHNSTETREEVVQEIFDFSNNEKDTIRFVPGEENCASYKLTRKILAHQTDFPLMVLWGQGGTGKETLATGVYRQGTRLFEELAKKKQAPQTAIISAIGFQSEFVACFQGAKDSKKALQVLQDKLRVRLLIITDLNAFCGRDNKKTADALSQAVTWVIHRGGRVLITMSVEEDSTYEKTVGKIHPTIVEILETKGFADFQIRPANLESRIEILSQLSGPSGQKLKDDHIRILANQHPNVAKMIVVAKKFLHGIVEETTNNETPSPQKIIETIEARSKLFAGSLVGPSRVREIVQGRHLAMYLIDELYPNMTAENIGGLFGRDRSSALYANQQIVKRLGVNIEFQDFMKEIRKLLSI